MKSVPAEADRVEKRAVDRRSNRRQRNFDDTLESDGQSRPSEPQP